MSANYRLRIISITLLATILFSLFTPFGGQIAQAAPADAVAAPANFGIEAASIVSDSPSSYGSAVFRQRLDTLKQTGANMVQLHYSWYQDSAGSSRLYRGADTPTDASLISAMDYANQIGMKVSLQPTVEINTSPHVWRSYINPKGAARDLWWQEFKNLQMHYARLAQTHGVDVIVMGTEMTAMSSQTFNAGNAQRWRDIISSVRRVYDGKLTYSSQRAGFREEVGHQPFVHQLDYLGISGYYNLNIQGSPTVAKFKSEWAKIERDQIQPLWNKYQKPIYFAEVGYRSVDNANKYPANYSMDGALNTELQQMLYQALLSFWKDKPYFKGLSLWHWEATENPGGASTTSFTPQGKPAEQVMARFFGGRAVTPQPADTITIWWPTNNANLSGCQLFKGRLENAALSSYSMKWRVDGDVWNNMYDSLSDAPHKEDAVDVRSWTWRGTGPYTIDFQVTKQGGAVLPMKSVIIYTNPGDGSGC